MWVFPGGVWVLLAVWKIFWPSGIGGRWAARAALGDRMRLCGQFSWVCSFLADRDLVFQDFSLVVVPGMRLSCLAHAGAWRAALRAHREGGERSFAREGSGVL